MVHGRGNTLESKFPKNDAMKHLKIGLLSAGLMLCLSVLPVWAYGYYMLLRVVVCGAAGFAAYRLKNDPARSSHFVPLLILAVLFNPVIPIHLSRLLWLPVNLGVAVYFLLLSKKL